jgi:putative tryptophan/tyrosine transport system substrate-binding protein
MRRRQAMGLIGGALLCARAAAAQQPERALPVVGFLRNTAAEDSTHLVQAFRDGLSEAGYVEGRNVRIAYRWTGGRAERLPALAAELAALKVNVIVTLGNTQAVRAAKAATASIPIVFMLGTDPVELGFVASLARPGGNLTGVFNLNQQLAQKWLEVLHEIVPAATTFALLVNPTHPATTVRYTEAMQAAAQTLGLRIHVVQASADRDFDAAFANVREHRAGALAIAADALFVSRVDQLAALSLHHAVPALYPFREFAAAGGLASYGTDLADTYRSAGLYTGRILNGEKPVDLPVQQATKVELVLNLQTAKALGLTLPQTLIARADEVIE